MHNPAAHAQYQLSELELPSKRPSGRGLSSPPPPGKSVLADMTYSIEMVREHSPRKSHFLEYNAHFPPS
jgi:hypothetical protein